MFPDTVLRSLLCCVVFSAMPALSQLNTLAFKPVDTEFSRQLDRLIMVSANPNLLHIYNPLTGVSSQVVLGLAPLSLSVSPDGLYAAVGHANWISYVNLTTGVVEKNLPVAATVSDLALGSNGYVYVLPGHIINIATGVDTITGALAVGSSQIVSPDGRWAYHRDGSYLVQWDISAVPPRNVKYYDNLSCHQDGFWLTDSGRRLLNGCGGAVRAHTLERNGTLPNITQLQSASDSSIVQRIAVIPGSTGPNSLADSEIRFYDGTNLGALGTISLPQLTVNNLSYAWHGRKLFYSADDSRLYVLMQADSKSGLALDAGVIAISMGGGCGVDIAPTTGSASAGGGSVSVTATAPSWCVYQAFSTVPWLTVGSGGVALGNATVTIQAAPNYGTASRSGVVVIGGKNYTVTQSGATAAGTEPAYMLPFRPLAAEYTKSLDRVVMIGTAPDRLYILDPVTRQHQFVSLPLLPTALSVSPDGLHAAVGHDKYISYIDLTTGVIEKTLPFPETVADLALGVSHVYVKSASPYWASVSIVAIATGIETEIGGDIFGSNAKLRLHPGGGYLYVSSRGRWPLTDGVPGTFEYIQGNFSGEGGNYWFTEDGQRLLFGFGGYVLRWSARASEDGALSGTLWPNFRTAAAADSTGRRLIAAIKGPVYTYSYDTTPVTADTSIQFFSTENLASSGTIPLPLISTGLSSVASHGRYLFWSPGSERLYALVQADPVSALLNDYALVTVSLGASCGASFATPTASVPASASTGSATIAAPVGCTWHANSTAPWITVTTDAAGSGGGIFSYAIEANATTAARTGAIILAGGQTFTITQAAGSVGAAGPIHKLSFRVADAEYSRALDRIVLVSDSSSILALYDPQTRGLQTVNLSSPALAVSVSPDGLKAAVGQAQEISIISLQTLTIEKVLPISGSPRELILAGNGYVYGSFQEVYGWGKYFQVNIATSVETTQDGLYRGDYMRLHPKGDAIYTANTGSYPDDIFRFSIASGALTYQRDSPYHGIDGGMCGQLWFLADTRLLTACGNVFTTSATQGDDMKHAGRLAVSTGRIGSAAHSPARRTIASLPVGESTSQGQLVLHTDSSLALVGRVDLPKIVSAGVASNSHGRHVFWNNTSDRLYIIMQAAQNSGLLNDFAVFNLNPSGNNCTVTPGITVLKVNRQAGTGNISVIAASDCVWQGASNQPWLTVTAGSLGAGIGNVGFSVTANPGRNPRIATLDINGANVTVTQAGNPVGDKIGLYRAGRWLLDKAGSANPSTAFSFNWGTAASRPVTGDWNGDGITETGVYDGGYWYLDTNGNGSFDAGDKVHHWGEGDWMPVAGDWNGDGRTKIGVFRNGIWYLDANGDGVFTSGDIAIRWGTPGSRPVVGDWNGDGRTKVGVYVDGVWYLDYDGNGVFYYDVVWRWGLPGSVPVVGDWNGDGRTKIGVFDNGSFYLDVTGDGIFSSGDSIVSSGVAAGMPVTGDWNGDGKTDLGLFHSNQNLEGIWRIDRNGNGVFDDAAVTYGVSSDTPLAGNW